MAATTNGVHASTPPPAPAPGNNDTSAHKRKRQDDEHHPAAARSATSSEDKQTQRDILEVLQQYDTTPSVLEYGFDDTSEPALKKAKVEGDGKSSTISAKLLAGRYPSLSGIKADAVRASKSVMSEIRDNTKNGQDRLSVDDLKTIQKVMAFEELLMDLVDQETQRVQHAHTHEAVPKREPLPEQGGAVLTLFGNAPTPKQLFSSTPSGNIKLPVEEMSLPNGLTATKIMPAPIDDTKKGPTFEDTFAPPYSLAQLHPPKHKRYTARDMNITWEFKDQTSRSSKKGGYTVQPLSVGDWLSYGGVDDGPDAASPREKRKQRDRALSSSDGPKERPSKASLEESLAKEEEALFRRAYSSFLPSHDNAKSLVPAETKSMVWWYKMGEKKFRETLAMDPALSSGEMAIDPLLSTPAFDDRLALENGVADVENFEHAIEALDELDEDMVDAADADKVNDKTDVKHVLQQISVLLETLASYQRIRNATLPSSTSASRTPISPGPTLVSKLGKPDEPAEDEVKTYDAVRRELSYLVLKLPPYAVAKLDGDRLAELGVSALIPFETPDVKGTMEEDQVARLAKYNAMATAAGIATLTRGTTSTSSQHYNSTAQRTPAIGQAANTRYGQSSQYGSAVRTPAPAPSYQRSTSSQSQSQSQYGTPSTIQQRSGYGQPTQYTRPGAPQQNNYSNGQQYYQSQQRPPQQQVPPNYGGYSQQTPQTQQQRAPAYPGSQNQQWPSRTYTAPQHIQPQQQQTGSGRVTPSYPSNPQTPVNGALAPRPPPQNIAPRAASGTPQPPVQQQQQQQEQQQAAQVNGGS